MKPAAILIAILALSAATSVAATEKKKTYRCTGTAEQCRYMPVPPVPPTPPTPPTPPAPPSFAMDAPDALAMASFPAPPALPDPPEPPGVPAAAHAACDGRSPGTRITYTPSKNETLTGTCRRTPEGMRLELRSWIVEN